MILGTKLSYSDGGCKLEDGPHYLYGPSQQQHQLQVQQALDRREVANASHTRNPGGPSSSSGHASRYSRHSEDRIALQMAIGESSLDSRIVTKKLSDQPVVENVE